MAVIDDDGGDIQSYCPLHGNAGAGRRSVLGLVEQVPCGTARSMFDVFSMTTRSKGLLLVHPKARQIID
jgi:hypothetical protein